jgi:MoaA/NifB/PqqE/SkfB family radical SAM enzyme/predicted dehydrogenase
VTLGLGHACCTGLVCAHGGTLDARALDARLRGGGRQLVVRGAPPDDALMELVRSARGHGFSEVILATADLDRRAPQQLARAGLDGVRALVFSHASAVHDRLAGRGDALVGALVALRALEHRGVPLELEVPLLPLRLADPRETVDLALRALRNLRAIRFYVPASEVPDSLATPRFDALREPLREALARLDEAGVEARFDPSQGIPPCVLAYDPEQRARFRFRARERVPERTLAPGCDACALRESCGGPTREYARRHGGDGLSPLAHRLPGLDGRTRTARPRWGPREREAARHVRYLVLRPTVHCNQDCVFCSANESSGNAFTEPKTMLRAIARAAGRGVRRISFSGGEPTLSPHLPSFVRAAARCGVPEIELVTNGVLLDRAPKVRALVDAGLTHAFVSLHAHDETLSRTLTQKEGDHERTLRAIELLLEARVLVAVNHVITGRNEPYLRAFVEAMHQRFGGAAFLSFAFVTPQYKALDHPELWPRLSETRAHLLHAMARAVELGQPFVVGSRQGVPPCVLGPYAAWSDVFGIAAEAASEDAPQKVQGAACSRCRYRRLCTGLWRPYAERFGFDELSPIEGDPFTDDELETIRAHHRKPPWGMPTSFADAPPLVRDRDAERAPLPPLPRAKLALPVAREGRSRPVRVLWLGSGMRARQLAESAASLDGIAIAGVASPHAPDAPGWSPLPLFRDAREALEALRPDAALIAAATEAHLELARACVEAGIPALIEKPLARTRDEARALATLGGWLSCGYQGLFAPGLEDLAETTGALDLVRRVPPGRADAPRAWSRDALRESLHHLIAFAVRGRGALLEVREASFEGASRPERVRLGLALARGVAELRVDFAARQDELELRAERFAWRRRDARIEHDGSSLDGAGSDDERMLRAFVEAVTRRSAQRAEPPPVPTEEGVLILEAVERVLDAIEAHGAPLSRATAPKHVVSGRYRVSPRR